MLLVPPPLAHVFSPLASYIALFCVNFVSLLTMFDNEICTYCFPSYCQALKASLSLLAETHRMQVLVDLKRQVISKSKPPNSLVR